MDSKTLLTRSEMLKRIGELLRDAYDDDWEAVSENLAVLHTAVLRTLGPALSELDAAIAVELDQRR